MPGSGVVCNGPPGYHGAAMLPDGQPYRIASFPSSDGRSYSYECAACRRVTTLSVWQYNALPVEEIEIEAASA